MRSTGTYPNHRWGIEPLEERQLLAVDLLANIDIQDGALFSPRSITSYNGDILVRGNDGKVGPEIWITNGTPEDTRLLKDIRVGPFGSGPRDFVEFQGRLFFGANNGFNGYELYVTQGTKATTQLVADIWPGSESGIPTDLIVYKNELYFFANDGETGRELYRSDGTAEGTVRVADSVEGRGGSSGEFMMVVGDLLFFVSDSTVVGESGLWVSDGSAEGTQPLVIPGVEEDDISLMTAFADRLVFKSNDQLWVTDGTLAGTSQLVPQGDALQAGISSISVSRGKLYVTDDGGLREIDSSLTTATLIANSAEGATSSNGKVYFWNANGFYVVDATSNSPLRLIPFQSFFGTKMGSTFNVPGGMLFNLNKTLDQFEIWGTNGTPEGTKLVETVTARSTDGLIGFQQIGDGIYFAATNGNFRESLWRVPAPHIESDGPGVVGDLNGDFVVDARDIDAMFAAVAAQSSSATFDLNGDGSINEADSDHLIEVILGTRRGDLDLNGKVEFADFLKLAGNFGKQNAGWADGDLDGDGEVAFADFLALAATFGFAAED